MTTQHTNKNVAPQVTIATFMSPLVGSEWRMPKHPSKLSATTKTFAGNLQALLDHYDLSDAAAGRKCRTSDEQIRRWRKCETSPTLDGLHKVARGFSLEPYQLLIENLEPRNLATVIAADTLARVSRARELLRDLDGTDEEGDGQGPGHRPDPPRSGPSASDSRREAVDRRRTKEKKPRP